MTTIADITAALATTVASDGLHVYDYVPDSIGVSGAVCVIVPGPMTDLVISRARSTRSFRLLVGTPKSTDRPSQTMLWTYVDGSGSASIYKKLHDSPTLGGVVESAAWKSDGGLIDLAEVIGLAYWGFEIQVDVVFTTGV